MKNLINIIGAITIGFILYIILIDDGFWTYLIEYVWNPFINLF